jgi:ABC-type multidrug transport system fused ATPase/permease subunit
MATKRASSARAKSTTTRKKRTSRKKKRSSKSRPPMPSERMASRVWQAAILLLGSLLLFSALVSPSAGPVIVGALMLVTAFPPARGVVDTWLTGKRTGKVAEQAAAIRMTMGAAMILFSLLSAVTRL